MWSCALAAFSESTSPAEQVLGQLLVPGQLCLTSLRQALAYHGSQLTEQEAASASLAQLKVGSHVGWLIRGMFGDVIPTYVLQRAGLLIACLMGVTSSFDLRLLVYHVSGFVQLQANRT